MFEKLKEKRKTKKIKKASMEQLKERKSSSISKKESVKMVNLNEIKIDKNSPLGKIEEAIQIMDNEVDGELHLWLLNIGVSPKDVGNIITGFNNIINRANGTMKNAKELINRR